MLYILYTSIYYLSRMLADMSFNKRYEKTKIKVEKSAALVIVLVMQFNTISMLTLNLSLLLLSLQGWTLGNQSKWFDPFNFPFPCSLFPRWTKVSDPVYNSLMIEISLISKKNRERKQFVLEHFHWSLNCKMHSILNQQFDN